MKGQGRQYAEHYSLKQDMKARETHSSWRRMAQCDFGSWAQHRPWVSTEVSRHIRRGHRESLAQPELQTI